MVEDTRSQKAAGCQLHRLAAESGREFFVLVAVPSALRDRIIQLERGDRNRSLNPIPRSSEYHQPVALSG